MTAPLPQGWETQVLQGIGAPVTPTNIHNLDIWQIVEGGSTNNPDTYNPFNTTLPEPGSFGTNSVGVQAFPNWSEGLNATVRTLEQQNMAGIRSALQQGAPTSSFEAAVNASPWGTHFSGAAISTPTGGTGTGAPAGAQLASASLFPGGSWDPLNWPTQAAGAAGGAAWNAIWSTLQPLFLRSTLIVVGIIVLLIGVSQLFKGGQSVSDTVSSGATVTKQRTVNTVKRANTPTKRSGSSGDKPSGGGQVKSAAKNAENVAEEGAEAAA